MGLRLRRSIDEVIAAHTRHNRFKTPGAKENLAGKLALRAANGEPFGIDALLFMGFTGLNPEDEKYGALKTAYLEAADIPAGTCVRIGSAVFGIKADTPTDGIVLSVSLDINGHRSVSAAVQCAQAIYDPNRGYTGELRGSAEDPREIDFIDTSISDRFLEPVKAIVPAGVDGVEYDRLADGTRTYSEALTSQLFAAATA